MQPIGAENVAGPLLIVGVDKLPTSEACAAFQKEDPVASSWKIWTRNENVSLPVEGLETTQYDSKQDALEAGWQLIYGPTGNLHIKVVHIEGPNGERIGSDEIAAWFKAHSATPR